jgi:hypothetical protein
MSYNVTEIEKNTFILCFIAIIWKRIFISVMLYSEKREIPENKSILMKCIKYNLLAPTGILNILRPYLDKALEQGFLMPSEYQDNLYVKKAINFFREAYDICKITDENYRRSKEKEFIMEECSKIFSEFEATEKEKKDIIKDISLFPEVKQSFVELADLWDLHFILTDREKFPIRYAILSIVFEE